MGRSIRHKLVPGKEEQIAYRDVLDILEAAEVETSSFFARLFGIGNPLSFDLLRPAEKPGWPKRKREIVQALESLTAAGSDGFEEARPRLLEIEALREANPRAADAAAWKLLNSDPRPGAAVGILAVTALGAPRAQGYELLDLASEILGPQLNNAAGGKFSIALGRFYTKAGFPRDAITILTTRALPLALLFGAPDEQARAYFHIAQAAGMVGSDSLQLSALQRAADLDVEDISFAAKQLLAFQELNTGDVEVAADMYDRLIASPYFERASRRACAYVRWSRLSAHFAAGRLGPADELAFKSAFEETKVALEERDQVAATLDLVLFLESIGQVGKAQQHLESALWNVLSLDDHEVQQQYIEIWKRLGLPQDARIATLVSRQEPTDLRSWVFMPRSPTFAGWARLLFEPDRARKRIPMSGESCNPEVTERMTVVEAQDAIAASFGEIEKMAWRFFAIARDLEVPEQNDDFAFEEPGPDHLRWFTMGACLAGYYDLLDLLERLRSAATRTKDDLLDQWRDEQDRQAKHDGADQEPTAPVRIQLVKAPAPQEEG